MCNNTNRLYLPWELWVFILEEVARLRFPGWASCAAVCRDWQAFIEPRNFDRIRLTASCPANVGGISRLDEFPDLIIRQRSLVKHIDLIITLPEYGCPCCSTLDPADQEQTHNTLAATAIEKLFTVLSSWEPLGELVLELNALSPSDTVHVYTHHLRGIGSQDEVNKHNIHEDVPNKYFLRPPGPISNSIARIHGMLCWELPWELPRLPKVHAVTKLVIPRELRRAISANALGSMLQNLPRLQDFVYEPWRRTDDRGAQDLMNLILVFGHYLPQSIQSLKIFENAIVESENSSSMDKSANFAAPRTELCRALFMRSLRLERLSVSGMIEGVSFFRLLSPQSTYRWDQLRSLTLTSAFLRRSTHPDAVLGLLIIAREAALRMPLLEGMVLWSCAPGEAGAFIFERRCQGERSKAGITITWRATWNLPVSRSCLASWEDLASDCEFRVEEERIAEKITCHGDAIRYLCLTEVADSKTLWQLQQEGLVDRELDVGDLGLGRLEITE